MTESARVPQWLHRELFPFESQFIELNGHSIHYVDEGSGPTLLLLHGNPTWSFLYRELIKRLSSSFRCIAVDYPGFGLSRAAEGYDFLPASHAALVDAFVRALELDDFALMVQDWGGPIGLWVAAQHAAKVSGLIIGNTWAWPIDGDKHFERFSKMMGGPLGGWAIRNFNAFVNVMIPLGVKRKKLPKAVMEAYRRPLHDAKARQPSHIFPREIRASSAFLGEVEAGLQCLVEKPALILWGDKDVAFRAQERARFEGCFPRHQSHTLHGAGHYIQEDAPDEIAEHILAWWPLK